MALYSCNGVISSVGTFRFILGEQPRLLDLADDIDVDTAPPQPSGPCVVLAIAVVVLRQGRAITRFAQYRVIGIAHVEDVFDDPLDGLAIADIVLVELLDQVIGGGDALRGIATRSLRCCRSAYASALENRHWVGAVGKGDRHARMHNHVRYQIVRVVRGVAAVILIRIGAVAVAVPKQAAQEAL